jgi:hypothetical protein
MGMERITRERLDVAAENLNRRLNSTIKIVVEGRNGYYALDKYAWNDYDGLAQGRWICMGTIYAGKSKRELYEGITAMIRGVDLANEV